MHNVNAPFHLVKQKENSTRNILNYTWTVYWRIWK